MTCKWLITMVIVSPQDLGLWDPFQVAMAYNWVLRTIYQSWDKNWLVPIIPFARMPVTLTVFLFV